MTERDQSYVVWFLQEAERGEFHTLKIWSWIIRISRHEFIQESLTDIDGIEVAERCGSEQAVVVNLKPEIDQILTALPEFRRTIHSVGVPPRSGRQLLFAPELP